MAVSAPVSTVDPPDLSFGPTARHLVREWWVERRLVGIGLLCALATTAFGIAIPVLVQRVIDNSIVARDHSELALYLVLIAVCACLRFATNSTRRAITSRIGIVIENRLRATLYDAYLTYPRAFYDRHATGQVLSRATNDLYPIRYFIGWGVVQVCSSVMMIIGVTIVLLGVNARLALYAGLTMPLIALLTWRFARLVTPLSRVVQQRKAYLTEAADESIVGMEMVQAFGREAEVRERFRERAEGVRQSSLREAGVEARYLPGLTFLPSMAIASVLFFGGRDVIDGNLTIGQFVLFNSLLLQLVWPLEALGWILNLAQRAIASASRAFAWLDAVQPLPEAEHPARLPDGGLDVRFEDVCFAYAGGSPVLCELDLEIAAGSIVAVCGETGSGKSTMLNLLSRFYDPDSGSVRVGGIEVSALRKADLRTGVALVTQRPVLFSLPLRENLCAARPEATEEEMLAACEVAGVAAFIDDLPDGYDTLIGERGVNLSGGQRQRVALARALISSARVLVLDDPLSAVDTENEEQIVRRLRPALAGRTVLLASQRLSTVALADRAVVLEDGAIVEDGPPRSLLAAGGTFERLFGDEVRVA